MVMTATLRQPGMGGRAGITAAAQATKSAASDAGAKASPSHVRETNRLWWMQATIWVPIDGVTGAAEKPRWRKYIAVPPPAVPEPADRTLARPSEANERRERQ